MQTAFLRTALVCCAAALLSACGGKDVTETPAAAAQAVSETCKPESRAEARARRPALEEAALAAAQESRGNGAPALWKMSDEDTVIYLFGTVHLLRPDMQWQTPVIEAAIASADTVVFEADVSSPEAQRELMKFYTGQGFFTDGTQLTNLLSGTETEELTEALQLVDLPVEALQPYKPWMAAINISVKQMIDEGFDPEAGVEKVIERAALEHGASFAFLETVDDQLGGLAGLNNCHQIDFLMATVDGLEDGTAALDLLVEEWADGDVNGLGTLMSNPEMLGSQPIYDAMMTDRNARWVPKIEAMLDSPGTVFVAVGAGHLAGEDSVIEMLRGKGHVVEGP